MPDSNTERTGDRDIGWSAIMRLPSRYAPECTFLRSCDLDVPLFCDKCSLPIFLVEATRGNRGRKPHRYLEAVAQKLHVPAYVIGHGECELNEKFELINDPWVVADEYPGGITVFAGFASQWKTFCESKFRDHMKATHGTF